MSKKRLNFVVPEDVHRDLRSCQERGQSATMTEAFRRAIGLYGTLLEWSPTHEIIARDPATGKETRLYLA